MAGKTNKPIVGFQIDMKFIISMMDSGTLKDLMDDVEEYIEAVNDEYVLNDFKIVPIYEEK